MSTQAEGVDMFGPKTSSDFFPLKRAMASRQLYFVNEPQTYRWLRQPSVPSEPSVPFSLFEPLDRFGTRFGKDFFV